MPDKDVTVEYDPEKKNVCLKIHIRPNSQWIYYIVKNNDTDSLLDGWDIMFKERGSVITCNPNNPSLSEDTMTFENDVFTLVDNTPYQPDSKVIYTVYEQSVMQVLKIKKKVHYGLHPKNGFIYRCFNADGIHPHNGGKDYFAEGARKSSEFISGLFLSNGISVTEKQDLTYREMQDAIKEAFKTSDEDTYNYVYIACHGNVGGLDVLRDGEKTYYSDYSNFLGWFAGIPGKVFFMIDACQSGGMAADNHLAKYSGKFEVLTSSRVGEDTYGNSSGTCSAQKWCMAAGYDYKTGKSAALLADTNGDGKVSFSDIAMYTQEHNHAIISKEKMIHDDTSYPAEGATPIFGMNI